MEINKNFVLIDNPADPNELYDFRSQHPLDKGFIDVTKPPYNTDPTGAKDCSAGIQKAVNDGTNYATIEEFNNHIYYKNVA